jgi:protein-disulfide isomerase
MAKKTRGGVAAAKGSSGSTGSMPDTRKKIVRRPARRTSPVMWIIGAAVVVVVALVIISNLRSGGATKTAATADNPRSIGPADAKVVVTEFSDFQCPYCERFFSETQSQLVEKYVNTGKVRFEYKHFIVIGQESIWAAEASECAADQGKFWEYHDLLFQRQSGENVGAFTKAKLKGFATELKLNRDTFDKCLDTDQYKSRVEDDSTEGRNLGVQSTPSFFVNKRAVLGAQPFSVFQNAIEQELAATNGG